MVAQLILAGLLLNLIIQAFSLSAETGIKSLAATALPLLITGFISFSNRSPAKPKNNLSLSHGLLNVIPFVLSGIWIIFLMLFVRYTVLYFNREVPLGEVALSITLSIYILVAEQIPFKSLVGCAYGIISGLLIYILIFGLAF